MTTTNAPATVIYLPANVKSEHVTNFSETYPQKQSIGFGITQIIIGSLCILFNVIDVAFMMGPGPYLGPVGHGIWCGILFIVTGGLGVGAGKKKTKCMIVSYMVMCIISATFTTVVLILGALGAVISGDNYYQSYYRSGTNTYSEHYLLNLAMESCLAIMALIAAVLFIWGAVICCKSGICRCSSSNVSIFVPANFDPTTGQVVYLAQPPAASDLANATQPNNPPPYGNYQQGLNAPRLDFHSSTEALVKIDQQ